MENIVGAAGVFLHYYCLVIQAHTEGEVANGSKSDVQVYVRAQLTYSITGTGNIYLYGNPGVIIPGELYSTGKLIMK